MPGHAKTLNPRQLNFVQNVAFGSMSFVDAARAAGYKDGRTLRVTAANLAKLPIVQAEIDRLRPLARATVQINAEHWRAELASQYNDAKQEHDRSNALRALELWGKHLGLLESRGDVDSANSAKLLLDSLAHLMGKQLNASLPAPSVTIDAHVRDVLGDS